jgi:DNA-binding SARP family transcriptional activator/tetratricopeptide (TPR) repeat protein
MPASPPDQAHSSIVPLPSTASVHHSVSDISGTEVRFGLLGSIEVRDVAGAVVDLGGAQPRKVLAVLLAADGRVVATDTLIDAVWGESTPVTAPGTLQTYVSRLRRVLEPGRRPRGASEVLVTEPQGYRLVVEPPSVDAKRFEILADAGREAAADGRLTDADAALREAEALWRGPALAEHRDEEWAQGLAARLEERRLAVQELRMEIGLALGRVTEVAAEATAAVRAEPLREARWGLLALALYRSGRQGEALRALGQARRTLGAELGLEPGKALRDLEAAILAQAPHLDADAPTATHDAPAPHRTRLPSPAGPTIVGRLGEMEALRHAWTEAKGATRFVVVEGEPGIGKTCLLEAIAAEAADDGALVTWGRTHESGAAPAYWPWLGAMRTLVDHRPDLAARLDPLLDPAVVGDAGPAGFRLHEAVASALETAAAHAPVVVLLDDLQWADAATLDLIAFLTTRLVDAPVLVGVTLRTLELGRSDGVTTALSSIARRPGSRRLRLRGIDEADAAALAALTAGRPVAPAVVAAVHARSGGNPFFSGELVRLLTEEDLLDDAAAVANAPVPAGVGDVLRRRLDRLPDDTVEVLRVGAVLGRDIEVPLVAAAAGCTVDACLDALEPAVTQRLVTDGAEPPAFGRFAHALVREVLVEDMTTAKRARLHLRAADALLATADADDAAELVAEHLWAAVPLGVGARAAEALERAAAVAGRRAAFTTAADLLGRALSLRRAAASSPEEAGLELATLMTLAGVTRSLNGYTAVLPLLERGRALATRLGADDILLNLEWAEWAAADTADFPRADPVAERFRAMAEEAAPDEIVKQVLGHGVWGIRCWHHGRIDEAVEHLDRSRSAAADLPTVDLPLGMLVEQKLLIEVSSVTVHELAGDLDEVGLAHGPLVGSQDNRFARAMVAGFESIAAAAVGDMARVGRASRAGLAADPDVTFWFWGAMNQMCAAAAALAEGGDPDEAVALFEEGHARYRRDGTRTGLGLLYATMAIELSNTGELDRARSYLTRAQHDLTTRGERWPEPVILLAEAEVRSAEGAAQPIVRELLERARDAATEQGSHAVARRMARTLDALDDVVRPTIEPPGSHP